MSEPYVLDEGGMVWMNPDRNFGRACRALLGFSLIPAQTHSD
jgi:hypothetical protein